MARPKILYLVTEDWYFLSHRLPMARGAMAAGFGVVVATRVGADGTRIAEEGFALRPLGWRRGGRNPFRELLAIIEIARIYRRERPDIVHHVAMKPILHGSIAAWIAGVPHVVNAFTGLGRIFIAEGPGARAARWFFGSALRVLLNRRGVRAIFQNHDDVATLRDLGILRSVPVTVIPGSGVALDQFARRPEPDLVEAGGAVRILCVSRMLWDKGIGELAEAARLLKARGVPARVILVGPPDPENPASIPEATLRDWHESDILTWLGPRRDIPDLLADCHVAVLPSYREGLPKSLLEAAAAGRPMVASDVPGCREVCRHDVSGLLVPVREAEPLADALQRLAADVDLRQRLGAGARHLAETVFAEDHIVAATVALYRSTSARSGNSEPFDDSSGFSG